tara:strand:- start:2690 stop:3955 length:1266 start_codon:yes stop_codon:yes gene_type:complete
LRIFLGVDGLGRYGELLHEGLSNLGASVDLCDSRPTRDLTKLTPKFNIFQLRELFQCSIKSDKSVCYLQPSKSFLDFVDQYDCFIFYFADSFYPGMLDIPLLSKLGKRVIFGSAGEDTICPYIEQIRGEWRGREHLSDMLSKMMPEPVCHLDLVSKWYSHHNTLSRKMYMIRMVEKYGSCLLPTGASGLARKPFYRALPICDHDLLRRGEQSLKSNIEYPIRLSHYMSNATTKSSTHIKKLFDSPTLSRLATSGLLQLNLSSRLSQADLFESLLSDHIVVDQLAAYGTLTRQAASLCTIPCTGPNAESHIYKDGFMTIPSIEIWSDSQFESQISYLVLNLDALVNYRETVFNAALSITPERQAARCLSIIKKDIQPDAINSWANHHLSNALSRLSVCTSFISDIDNSNVLDQIDTHLSSIL